MKGTISTDLGSYKDWLDRLMEVFGENRVIFGSDWPNSDGVAPVDKVFAIAKEDFATRVAGRRREVFLEELDRGIQVGPPRSVAADTLMLNLVVRSTVWVVAFFWLAFLEKPSGASFADIRTGPPGWIGLGLIALGIGFVLWSMLWLDRVVRQTAAPPTTLVSRGPYDHVRNPLYLSAGVVAVGIVTIYTPWSSATVVRAMVVALLVHVAVVRMEEPRTLRRLGPIYEEYCRRVPRWVPGFEPARPGEW